MNLHNKTIWLRRLHRGVAVINILVLLTTGMVVLQHSVIEVKAELLPVVVSTNELSFGTVFPGEFLTREFTVEFDGEEIVDYRILQQRKPLPEEHPEYPDGGDPDMPGYYRDLCPYLTKVSLDGEGDLEGADGPARVSVIDLVDTWQVEFEVPAIVGNIAQDHTGGFVSFSGEYGCDIYAADPDELPLTQSVQLGNNTLFATDRGGSGIEVMGESSEPNLVISKTHTTSGEINPGDNGISYEILVSNNGNVSAFNTILYDQLPPGFTYPESGLDTMSWNLGDIAPGEIKRINYNVDVGAEVIAGEYSNLVSASAANHGTISAIANTLVEDEVIVLGVSQEFLESTGFSNKELLIVLGVLMILFVIERILKKSLIKIENKPLVK